VAVTTTTNKKTYTSDGTTSSVYLAFNVVQSKDIKVYVDITGVGDAYALYPYWTFDTTTLILTFTAVPASGTLITIIREPDILQENNYLDGQIIHRNQLENDYDRMYHIMQNLQDQLDRTLKLPVGYSGSDGLQLPVPQSGYYLIWDSGGDLVNTANLTPGTAPVSSYMEPVLLSASAAALAAFVDHNSLINTHNLTTDIDHDLLTNTHNLTTDIDHDLLANFVSDEHVAHSGVSVIAGTLLTGGGTIDSSVTLNVDEASIDHGSISGLADDDHAQYLLVDGSRAMTGDLTVGATPTLFVDVSENTVGIGTSTLSASTVVTMVSTNPYFFEFDRTGHGSVDTKFQMGISYSGTNNDHWFVGPGGGQWLIVDDDGKVGIGNGVSSTSLGASLHIQDTYSGPLLRLNHETDGAESYIRFRAKSSGGLTSHGDIAYISNGTEDAAMIFRVKYTAQALSIDYSSSTITSFYFGNSTGMSAIFYMYGTTANAYAIQKVTNGNFHIDAGYGAATGDIIYLNYYNGTHVYFGTGASGYHTRALNTGEWLFEGGTNTLRPGTDGSGNVGTASQRWASMNADLYNTNDSASYDKVRVWSSASYSIGMNNSMTFGYLSDYAMTFTMSNTANRGFIFRDDADAKSDGAMSITTDGRVRIKTTLSVAGGWIYDSSAGTITTSAGIRYRHGVSTAATALISQTGEVYTLQVYQSTTSRDAFMSFHISGDYAVHFGLDYSSNDICVGGWSMGAVKRRIFHQGNYTSLIDHNSLLNYASDRHRKITVSTSDASGGSDGDVHFKYA
jgi:hypothetical protein